MNLGPCATSQEKYDSTRVNTAAPSHMKNVAQLSQPKSRVGGFEGRGKSLFVRLDRRSKKRFAIVADGSRRGGTTGEVRLVRDLPSAGFRIVRNSKCGASHAAAVAPCERLDFMADNPQFAKRFAYAAAGRHRSETWVRNPSSTGTRSRRWRCSTCGPA
jgi:hypothetical protein